jgi:citronellol/citronellal dehydrogenase
VHIEQDTPPRASATELFAPFGSRALVTGGGTGIGRDITLFLSGAGVQVYVVGRRAEPLEETAASDPNGRIVALPADIRDPDQVDAAFRAAEAEGPLTMLVNSAAGAFLAPAESISPGGFAAVVASSLTGPFVVLSRWARALLASGDPGVALLLSSAFGSREVAGAAHSSAAKAGLEAMARATSVEWAGRGLRVNALAPGAFSTGGSDAGMWNHPPVRESALSGIPMHRFGTPDEVLGPAIFLMSRAASYVTGETLVVDGGWHLAPPPFGLDFPARTR